MSGHGGFALTLAVEDTRPEPPRSPAVFIDKDGTLVENVPYNVDPAKLRFTPHAFEGLRRLGTAGFKLVVVTNQPGIAFHFFDRAALTRLQRAMEARLAAEGIALAGFYACPHAPAAPRAAGCLCRKPAPGLLHQAAQALHLDLAQSWMVGDILDDIEAGQRAGCRTVLLDVGNETEWRLSPLRTPHARCGDLLRAAECIVVAPPNGPIHCLTKETAMRNAISTCEGGPSAGPLQACPEVPKGRPAIPSGDRPTYSSDEGRS